MSTSLPSSSVLASVRRCSAIWTLRSWGYIHWGNTLTFPQNEKGRKLPPWHLAQVGV